MQPEVVGAREAAVAVAAAKRLGTSVLTNVAGQLVGPSKAPFAFDPAALVRFFTGVGATMSLQMGALGVDFVTIGKLAIMHPAPRARLVAVLARTTLLNATFGLTRLGL